MTAQEMFEKLEYELYTQPNSRLIEYRDDSHGDGDYAFVQFDSMYKEFQVGYFDKYETEEKQPFEISIELYKAITQQMKELGWLE
jgi:hypothetical protein